MTLDSPVMLGAFFVVSTAASLSMGVVLVSRLERIAARLGLSEAVLGLVAALAADSPEIASAVSAFLRHERDIGAGVALGSNMFNLAALLGVATLVAGRITFHRRVVVLTGGVAAWCVLVVVGTAAGLGSPRVALLLVVVVLVPYVAVSGLPVERLSSIGLPA